MKHSFFSKSSFLLLITLSLYSFNSTPKHKYGGVGLAVFHHEGVSPEEWYELHDFTKKQCEIYNLPFDAIIGMINRESTFLSSELAVEANNILGIKAIRGEWKGEVYTKSHFDYDKSGNKIVANCNFRKYPSKKACILDFIKFLSHERYSDAWDCGKYDSKCFLEAVQKAGYTTDSNWANAINTLLNRDYEKLYGVVPAVPAYELGESTH